MPSDNTEVLYQKIKNLNELLWEQRVTRPAVDRWLDNFTGQCMAEEIERQHALYLLSKFLYFGDTQVRELLRAMFRDLVRHPLSVKVRAASSDKEDFKKIHEGFQKELDNTRFLGLGSPSESGSHILYPFRLINGISVDYFVNPTDLVTGPVTDPNTTWVFPDVNRLVFVDDFCGTGNQAAEMAEDYINPLRDIAIRSTVDVEVWYLTLLATTTGLNKLRAHGVFDRVECVSELDESYRVFGNESQIYANAPDGIEKDDGLAIAAHYGATLDPCPLGYANSQLLLGFHHNVPDNTLPIIWKQQQLPPWHPIFPRSEKH